MLKSLTIYGSLIVGYFKILDFIFAHNPSKLIISIYSCVCVSSMSGVPLPQSRIYIYWFSLKVVKMDTVFVLPAMGDLRLDLPVMSITQQQQTV